MDSRIKTQFYCKNYANSTILKTANFLICIYWKDNEIRSKNRNWKI